MLSLAMIVKNEAQTIERTIKSVRDHVDEVVVGVDTASSDGTDEIVKRLADKVISIHLTDELAKKGSVDVDPDWGFAKARNQVFDACDPENWRLVLDGHETIENPDKMKEALEKVKGNSHDGIAIWMHFEPRDDGIPQTMFETLRLMSPIVRYQNANHNVPVVKKPFAAHDVIVEHRKSDQATKDRAARDAQRSDSNIEGLKNKVRVDANDARSWFYLATAYKENVRYNESIKAYEECLKYSRWNEERWHARVHTGTCYNCLGDSDNARRQFVQALEEFPAMAEAYYCLGDLAYKKQHFREAQVWLEKCVQMPVPTCRLFVNPRTYMVDRHDLLSMVYNHLGQYDKAIEQAQKVLETAKIPRVEKNLTIWKLHVDNKP